MMKFIVLFCIALVSSQTTTICNCAADYHPVCDATGKQYSNQCQADCAGAKNTTSCPAVAIKPIRLFKNLLKKECLCTMEYSPVCDAVGKQYSNQCQADCAGEQVKVCPADNDDEDDEDGEN